MKTAIKLLAVLLMLCCVLVLVPSGSMAEIVEIPLNAAKGIAPYADKYVSNTEYEDPSIHVAIGTGTIYDTNYWYARVKIANASQLRTYMAGNYKNKDEKTISSMATSVNPVICINGDNFHLRPNIGFIARQGQIYREKADKTESKSKRRYDVLLIDDQGDLHILKQATSADIAAFEGTIIQGMTFGPALVVDGVMETDFVDMNNAPTKKARRACIAQVGPLEYLLICSEGPEDRPRKPGLTLPQFAELVSSFEDVKTAYNLDGGSAANMVFKGNRLNPNGKSRPLKDILYFSSAYVPDP